MDPSLDIPTLRSQLDTLIQDQNDFINALRQKQQQLDQLTREVQQYQGVIEYNRILQDKIKALLPVTSP